MQFASSVADSATAVASFTPCLQLRSETLLIDRGQGFESDYQAVDTAVIELTFDYDGVRVPASEARCATEPRSAPGRDPRAESQARRILEAFGAIDLGNLDDCATIPGSQANYAVHLDGDLDALCAFGVHAIPRLRALGWRVDVADDYPCQVVAEGRWYAELEGQDDRNWFELQLGVEVEGERVDLLPFLLEQIETRGSLAALASAHKRPFAVPVGERRYMLVPLDRLQAIARVLQELYDVEGPGAQGGVRLTDGAHGLLDQLDDAFGAGRLDWGSDGGCRDRVRRLSPRPPQPVEPPHGLQATLRPYQEEGLAFLQNLRAHGAGALLADDMGLGKTLQAIAHIVKERESGRMQRPALIIAPTSLVGNWQREFAKFAPQLDIAVYHGPRRQQARGKIATADVVITTYGLVNRERTLFESQPFYLQVLDEAHMIKNARSQAHQACKAIEAEYRICLSGTPVENNLDELWAMFDFVMPGLLGDAARFRTAFRYPIERDGNEERMATLRQRVSPFVLRRLKSNVASELPPKTEILRMVELRGEQRDLYESIRLAGHAAVRKAVKEKGIAASTIDILGALMKLRQVCCDPRLVRVGHEPQTAPSAKLDLLFSLVPRMLTEGRRILVFSQFTTMLALIAAGLKDRGIPWVSLTGATTNRQAAVDAFQGGQAGVFLISLKAGGTGLNLTRADTVIHFDPWWNPAAQSQATDRAYRIGQERAVFVYQLIAAGSVEERMMNLQRHKQALADQLLDGANDRSVELSEEQVDDLFAPLA